MSIQIADFQPGAYYVTASDDRRFWRMVGPFVNNHQAALDIVDAVRELATDMDSRAHWMSWGTVRFDLNEKNPLGVLNKHFGLPPHTGEHNTETQS